MNTIRHSRSVAANTIGSVISRSLRHEAARDRLRELRVLIPDLLGPKYELFREFDRLVHEIAIEREHAFFDVGFEHGAASSRVQPAVPDAARPERSKVVDANAAMLREWLVDTGLPLAEEVMLFIESTLLVALEIADPAGHAERS